MMSSSIINESSSCLVWPEHSRVMCDGLQQLHNMSKFVDVEVIAGHSRVWAHRTVLAAASPVLFSQLQHNNAPLTQIHLDSLVEECTGQELRALVTLLYWGEVCVPQHRLSIFLNIARQLQLVGFQEASLLTTCGSLRTSGSSQRTAVGNRSSLHILNLPEPSTLQASTLQGAELQNLLPIPLSTFPMPESQPQPQIPTQLFDNDILNQNDSFMGNNISDTPLPSSFNLHGKFHQQKNTEDAGKYCEMLKLDNSNIRNFTESLSSTSFSDLCPSDPLFPGDNRPINGTFRPIHSESSESISGSFQGNGVFPRDYSQEHVKLMPNMLYEEVELVEQHQAFIPVNENINMDWTMMNGNSFAVADSLQSNVPMDFVQHYQVSSDTSSSVTAPLCVSDGNTLLQPVLHALPPPPPHHQQQLLLRSQDTTATAAISTTFHPPITTTQSISVCNTDFTTTSSNTCANTSNLWSFGSYVPTMSDAASYHKWCIPDEGSLPEFLDCSQQGDNFTSGGGGRLKVKSSIGGVSVQDLSRASIQDGRKDESTVSDDAEASNLSESSADAISMDTRLGLANKSNFSIPHATININNNNNNNNNENSISASCTNSKDKTCGKIPGGKLIVRTDIETVCYNSSATTTTSLASFCSSSGSKTASISVVPSEELLETRHHRDDALVTSPTFTKLSVVPAQQLLQVGSGRPSLPTALTLQGMVYGDDARPQQRGLEEVPRIKLHKPHQSRLQDLSLMSDAENVGHGGIPFASPTHGRNADFRVDRISDEIHTPIRINDDEDFLRIQLPSDPDEVLVVPENEIVGSLTESDNSEGMEVQVMEQPDSPIESYQLADSEEDLPVILQASLQLHLPHYHCSPETEPVYHQLNGDHCEEITPIKDTAKVQWESLQQDQTRQSSGSIDFHSEQRTIGNNLKVKKSLFNSLPISRSQTPENEEEAELEILEGDCDGSTSSTDFAESHQEAPQGMPLSLCTVSVPSSPMLMSPPPSPSTPQPMSSCFPENSTSDAVIDINENEPMDCIKLFFGRSCELSNNAIQPILTLENKIGTDTDKSDLAVTKLQKEGNPDLAFIYISAEAKEATVSCVTTIESSLGATVDTPSIVGLSSVVQRTNTNNGDLSSCSVRPQVDESAHCNSGNLDTSSCGVYNKNAKNNNGCIEPNTVSYHDPQSNCDELNSNNDGSGNTMVLQPEPAAVVNKFELVTAPDTAMKHPELDVEDGSYDGSCNQTFQTVDLSSDASTPFYSNRVIECQIGQDPPKESVRSDHNCEVNDVAYPDVSKGSSDGTETDSATEQKPKDSNESAIEASELHVEESCEDAQDDFKLKCQQCPAVLSCYRDLLQHGRSHHTAASPLCCLCSRPLKSKATLRVHLITHIAALRTKKSVVSHYCRECGQEYSQRSNLARHMASQHQLALDGCPLTSPLKCPYCTYTSLVEHKLKSHVRSHSKEHKCPHCPYQTAAKNSLNKHLRTHSKEKPYVCDLCGFHAMSASILCRHKRSHTQEKPHKCGECGKLYADSKRLRDHLLMHQDKKPFKCHACPYTCRRNDNLQNHIRLVHGEGRGKKSSSKQEHVAPVAATVVDASQPPSVQQQQQQQLSVAQPLLYQDQPRLALSACQPMAVVTTVDAVCSDPAAQYDCSGPGVQLGTCEQSGNYNDSLSVCAVSNKMTTMFSSSN